VIKERSVSGRVLSTKSTEESSGYWSQAQEVFNGSEGRSRVDENQTGSRSDSDKNWNAVSEKDIVM